MEKIRGFLVILLFWVGACSGPLTQQALTPEERTIATEMVKKIAGKSFVGAAGSGDQIVDIQTNFGKNFAFDPSGGGQVVEVIRDRGAGPYSNTFNVVSMRLNGRQSISIVLPGNDSITFTLSFSIPPNGQIQGDATGWNPAHGMSWSAPLREGVLEPTS